MSQSRLGRAMARRELLQLGRPAPALGFAADPNPRPTLDATQLVGALIAQGCLPAWRVMAIGPEGEGLRAVLIDVALGPVQIPMALDAAAARKMAGTLLKAAADVEAAIAAQQPTAPVPDDGPDIVVTDQATG